MAPAKMRWLSIHAVSRSGLHFLNVMMSFARLGGGRGVKVSFSSSGEVTTQGRRTEPANVTMENTMRLKLLMRPISPRISADCLTLSGAE